MTFDHREWHGRSNLLHRILLVLILITVALPHAAWRDGMLVAGLVLLAIHLEFRDVVLTSMLEQRHAERVKADRPPEPDALGATPNESLPYS